MREFVVSKAPVGRVAALARDTVENAGGVVAQHSSRTTEFDHLQPDDDEWARSGYIGTYQRYGEDPVRLRIRAWASAPRKFFLWIVFLGLLQAVLFFALSFFQAPPPPNVWIASAILTFPLLAISFQMYATSWSDSADLEDALARQLNARIRDDPEIEGDIYTLGEWEEHRDELIEAAVQKAKERAPERPSRAKKVLQSVTAGTREQAGRVVSQFRTEDEEPTQEQAAETESQSLTDRVPFWTGSDDEDDEDEEAPAEADREEEDAAHEEEAEPDTDEEDEGFLDRFAFWTSSDEEDDEQEAAEPGEEAGEEAGEDERDPDAQAKRERLEALKQKRAQMSQEEDPDTDDEDGLMSRLAFWSSKDEGEEDAQAGGDEAAAEDAEDPEAKKERLAELKRRREALAGTQKEDAEASNDEAGDEAEEDEEDA